MDIAEVRDAELEYDVVGTGEPVLLISSVLPDGFAPMLTQPELSRFRRISYHKRGWVGSTHSSGPVSVADHAEDAVGLLDHLGVARAHVAGHSSGAAVAVELALRYPDRVATAVLLEPSLFSLPEGAAFLAAAGPLFELYAEGEHDAAVAVFLETVSGLSWERAEHSSTSGYRVLWRRR